MFRRSLAVFGRDILLVNYTKNEWCYLSKDVEFIKNDWGDGTFMNQLKQLKKRRDWDIYKDDVRDHSFEDYSLSPKDSAQDREVSHLEAEEKKEKELKKRS